MGLDKGMALGGKGIRLDDGGYLMQYFAQKAVAELFGPGVVLMLMPEELAA